MRNLDAESWRCILTSPGGPHRPGNIWMQLWLKKLLSVILGRFGSTWYDMRNAYLRLILSQLVNLKWTYISVASSIIESRSSRGKYAFVFRVFEAECWWNNVPTNNSIYRQRVYFSDVRTVPKSGVAAWKTSVLGEHSPSPNIILKGKMYIPY